ncbi:MAG: type II toxin-antitoxin system VapC family toxin [Verrucomicrobiales bacterium]
MGDKPLNFLLDTHVWVWAAEAPERLGPRMRKELADPQNGRSVCCVSTLEIARLVAGGDIILKVPLADWVAQSLSDLRVDSLPVNHETALEAYRLPEPFHKDPADRQIVACARLHGLRLATADERILRWKYVFSVDARK